VTTRYAQVTVEQADTGTQKIGVRVNNWISRLAAWIALMITILPVFVGRLLSSFFGDAGALAIAGFIFLGGLLVNTNSYWQAFGNRSFFPWYFESPWTGWASWGAIVLSLPFWVAIATSLATTRIQAKVWRGNADVKVAELEFDHWNAASVPAQPGENKLQMAKVAWRKLKNTGVAQHRTISYGALATWAFEFSVAFAQNNPFRFEDPAMVAGCVAFVLLTGMAPEFGYAMWQDTLDNYKRKSETIAA
jgi:hypothetical protein